MNVRQLIDSHPEVLQDRFSLSFTYNDATGDIARLLRHQGVVMLRNLLQPQSLASCRDAFAEFARTLGRRRAQALR